MIRAISLDCLTLPDASPVELIHAAGAAGFASVSLWVQPPAIAPNMLATPDMAEQIRRALAETGISIGNLEVFNLNGDDRVEAYAPMLAFGAELGAKTATAIDYGTPRDDMPQRLAAFTVLCTQHGLSTLVEPISMGNVRTPQDGAALIRAAGVEARLVLDAVHLVRTGTKPHALRDIPPELIGYFQICDGPTTLSPEGIDVEATANRLYPGEGAFPLAAYLAALPDDTPLGVEGPSLARQRRGASFEERAREAFTSTHRLLRSLEEAGR